MTQQQINTAQFVKIEKIENLYRIIEIKTNRIYGMAYDRMDDAIEALEGAKKSDYWFNRQA